MRIEPPPSLPWLNGATPAAVIDEAPPDEPPGEWPRFQGLRVVPCRGESVSAFQPNSGVVLLPMIGIPAAQAGHHRRILGGGSLVGGMRADPRRPALHRRGVLDRG